MAFFAGASSTNFGGASPTGNFVPQIYSQKVLNFFRTKSTVEAITNSDYYGEISAFGDTVRVIKEPVITVSNYLRGDTLTSQALADNQLTLALDQAKFFQFEVDDIETAISHIGWQALATDSAAYGLKNSFDQDVLDLMSLEASVLAANISNDTEHANLLDLSTPDALLNEISHLSTLLTLQDVPEEGRWLVISPVGMETLAKADSKLINMDFNGGISDLGNGLVSSGKLRGFSLFMTNNAPTFQTLTTVHTHDVLLAGHMSATATVSAILDTEVIRSTTTFADIIRGKHVYGRTVVRPEALAISHVTYITLV